MIVTPTFPAAILAGLSSVLLVLGLVLGHLPLFAWSGSMLTALAVARLLCRASVSNARAGGFEMLWKDTPRFINCYRNSEFSLSAELRNRSDELLVLESISQLASPELDVTVEPERAALPSHSSIRVRVTVTPRRVGLHGIQGLKVVLRDDLAAFESQLTFASPLVLEVIPEHVRSPRQPLRGGRGVYQTLANQSTRLSGESLEFRELREHQRGESLRKVAWKASARRGRLLVRDDEQEQHQRVHFLLDASVELWAGSPGSSALDLQIERVASTIRHALRRGDRVGLTVVASRVLADIAPDAGKAHERQLLRALSHTTGTRDADRSGLDEQDVVAAVLEHLRPVDPVHTRKLTAADADAVARLAQRHLLGAPFPHVKEPLSTEPRDRLLRQYLAAFGLPSPARTTTDRNETDRILVETIKHQIAQRPDRIVVCSPWPTPRVIQTVVPLLRRLKRARIALDWLATGPAAGIPSPAGDCGPVVIQAVEWYADAAAQRGQASLLRLGVHASPLNPLPSAHRTEE